MKQSAGFISGKRGLRKETRTLRQLSAQGIPSILNDITTCLKHGDLTIPTLSKPILLEIKTSSHKNERVHRQEKWLSSMQKYLVEDELTSDFSPGVLMRRVAMSFKERNHSQLANSMLQEAYSKGFCYRKVENGLFYSIEYLVFDDSSKNRLNNIINKCKEPPIHMSLNQAKYYSYGYQPISLTLREKEYVFDIFRGKIIFTILVDPAYMKEYFRNIGMNLQIFRDEMVLVVPPINSKDAEHGIRISPHLFGRIGSEFLSLDWFLKENKHKAENISKYWENETQSENFS